MYVIQSYNFQAVPKGSSFQVVPKGSSSATRYGGSFGTNISSSEPNCRRPHPDLPPEYIRRTYVFWKAARPIQTVGDQLCAMLHYYVTNQQELDSCVAAFVRLYSEFQQSPHYQKIEAAPHILAALNILTKLNPLTWASTYLQTTQQILDIVNVEQAPDGSLRTVPYNYHVGASNFYHEHLIQQFGEELHIYLHHFKPTLEEVLHIAMLEMAYPRATIRRVSEEEASQAQIQTGQSTGNQTVFVGLGNQPPLEPKETWQNLYKAILRRQTNYPFSSEQYDLIREGVKESFWRHLEPDQEQKLNWWQRLWVTPRQAESKFREIIEMMISNGNTEQSLRKLLEYIKTSLESFINNAIHEQTSDSRLLIPLEEAAKMLSVTADDVRNLLARGELTRYVVLDNKELVYSSEIIQWAQNRSVNSSVSVVIPTSYAIQSNLPSTPEYQPLTMPSMVDSLQNQSPSSNIRPPQRGLEKNAESGELEATEEDENDQES